MIRTVLLVCAVLVPLSAVAQTPSDHHAGVDARGDAVMGFSHEKTTHHFMLLADGGSIAATARATTDQESISQIRMHLRHVAQMFSDGNFEAPMLIHAKAPPGVSVMRERKGVIVYRFDDQPSGGRVRITTTDPVALDAVHAFLRFQIRDHRTGDSEAVQRP